MSIYRGGRGKKAPYKSVVIRVPKPLESAILELIQAFRDDRTDNTQPSLLQPDIEQPPPISNYPDKEAAIAQCLEILKSKESARKSLTKFLRLVYNDASINL
jgi:hypothetical protein